MVGKITSQVSSDISPSALKALVAIPLFLNRTKKKNPKQQSLLTSLVMPPSLIFKGAE